MATVAELTKELAGLPADQEVPATLLLSYLPRNIELSYVEAALSQWRETAESYGRDCHPEVDAFLRAVYEVL